jgi:endonuclease/exonuclease/phosphatase family metal-dependent hydrolase
MTRFYSPLLALGLSLVATACVSTPSAPAGDRIREIPVQTVDSASINVIGHRLRIASLNLAHGRRDSLNQILVSTSSTLDNLNTIAAFLQDRSIDIVALQEADAPSRWSGNFNHVSLLAREAEYPFFAHASQAKIGVANYGTGVLSKLPINKAMELTFAPSPPTVNKGFTLAELSWSQGESRVEPVTLDVISLHLDFSRSSVRLQQITELKAALASRTNPLIIMGDFNSESLAIELQPAGEGASRYLHTWPGDNAALATYKGKRLDWIVISSELEFVSYDVSAEVLSDHSIVIADIQLAPR